MSLRDLRAALYYISASSYFRFTSSNPLILNSDYNSSKSLKFFKVKFILVAILGLVGI